MEDEICFIEREEESILMNWKANEEGSPKLYSFYEPIYSPLPLKKDLTEVFTYELGSSQKKIAPFFLSKENYEPKNFKVELPNGEIFAIPSKLSQLVQPIEKSKYILDLEDNWDDEGAKGYSVDTWLKAIKFLIKYAEMAFSISGKEIEPPMIYHGPDGSIDLYWENSLFNLLMNIPEGTNLIGTFYGDDYDGQKIEGKFNLQSIKPFLFPILVNFR